MLNHAMTSEHRNLTSGFKKLMELDNETFVAWVDDHRAELDSLFFGAMSKTWEAFVNGENEKTEETAKVRVAKRREKLKQWYSEEKAEEAILSQHDMASSHWMKNIFASEHLKHQRAQQDQQDNFSFLASTFSKMDRELHRPCAVFENESPTKWKLDRTEGRNRMRLRMLPDRAAPTYDYQPKRRVTDSTSNGNLKLNTQLSTGGVAPSPLTTHSEQGLHGRDTPLSEVLVNGQQEGPDESF
jgi:hypothetical protein